MAEQTSIEWCDATFNPWIGCTKIGPGCDHCYAERSTPARTQGVAWGPHAERRRTRPGNWALPLRWERQHAEFYALHGRRRRVFCASLADVFDNAVPVQWRRDLFDLIEATPNIDWLLLTKRISNARNLYAEAYLDSARPWPGNVWLGATVISQTEADRDIPKLLATPARVRFLSMEPLLEPVSLRWLPAWPENAPTTAEHPSGTTDHLDGLRRLDWIIVGGESGPGARPMHPDWARGLRDQCAAAGVPYLFKQWGEWVPRGPESMGYPLVDGVPRVRLTDRGENGQNLSARGGCHCWMQRVGKKMAGRMLDGREHLEWPAP